ncbi:alginate export family protein [Yunchengibacter salinarum]|uniref:alginate export family protein n=1 Tax=Yunchengibacter salinarum TaxID=3133399 RepID=UPI0035B68DF7
MDTEGHAGESVEKPTGTDTCPKPGNPYKGVFYANDFGYLEGACRAHNESDDPLVGLTDRFKRMKLAENVTLDLGGQYRLRYHDENNHGLTRLNGLDNEFLLSRLRVYGNLEVGDHVRVYVEGIDAAATGESLPNRGIEVDRHDLLNGFVDVSFAAGESDVTLRAGRQELLFGNQRLISPLDWGNTRRTFDGFRANISRPLGEGDTLDVSLFAVRPREVEKTGFNDTNDSVDFLGAYATLDLGAHSFDLYSLSLEETGLPTDNFHLFTHGVRWNGRFGNLLGEMEAAIQRGNLGGQDHNAEMLTLGLGYDFGAFSDWKPKAWLYYDYASGDGQPNDGVHGTFRQHFPLAHAWLGLIDLVARQNIKAGSFKTSFQPTDWLTLAPQLHSFHLADSRDGLYNAGGAIIRRDPTGQAGSHVGEELDVVAKIKLPSRMGLMIGWSKFWGAGFIDDTNPAGVGGNADFGYVQWMMHF